MASVDAVDVVPWRLTHGSMCHVCPLNGQRKVGSDGPQDADVVLIGEAPGADEEQQGKPFVGKSGWALKVRLLGPAGLADIDESGQWPRVKGRVGQVVEKASPAI